MINSFSENRLCRLVIALVMLCCLAGCGVKIVYNQLDWLIPWYVGDYLDMDGEQDAFFEERLESYLAWHRKSQLPEYAAFLRAVASNVADGLTEVEVEHIQGETERLGRVLMERLAPDIIALFAGANDKQLTMLFDTLDKDGEGFRKRYAKLSLEQQREKQVEEVVETVERWTGALSDDQEAMIASWGQQYQPMNDELYQAGLVWRAEFKQILEQRGLPEQYRARFNHLLTTPDFGWSKSFNEKADENKHSLTQLYFSLDKTFTSKQRKRIIETLQNYANDFEQLAKDG